MVVTSHKHISKILIANRGEIAARVIRTCNRLGIKTVVIYSESDKRHPYLREATECVSLGNESEASKTYLNQEKIISAALDTHCQAIHPGYGFLSENPDFADKCRESGLIFIGPSGESIRAIGNKSAAKKVLSEKLDGIKVIPGYNGADQSLDTLEKEAKRIGTPLLIKASSGGGGKGMRVLHDFSHLRDAIDSAKTEAKNSFGDDSVLLERYLSSVRHIEIQIFGDEYGNVMHLFERECSLQRRHQKVIEESPSVALQTSLREEMGKAAVRIGECIKYVGAGTVEFLLDEAKNFYFLEVNTRLQVEHPVTELVTGLDLVELQILVASGYSLPELNIKRQLTGHAIECRLYAEDPFNNFFPSTGRLLLWQPHEDKSPFVRFDTGVETGTDVSVFYDPMISKIIAYGDNRETAVDRLIAAINRCTIFGIQTNKSFLLALLQHEDFVQGRIHTKWIENTFIASFKMTSPPVDELLIAAMLYDWSQRKSKRTVLHNIPPGWRNNFYRFQQQLFLLPDWLGGKEVLLEYRYSSPVHVTSRQNILHTFQVKLGQKEHAVTLFDCNGYELSCEIDGIRRNFSVLVNENDVWVHADQFGDFSFTKKSKLQAVYSEENSESGYTSKMPGKILKVLKQNGDMVTAGEVLVVMESMKMESKVYARTDGKLQLFVKVGDFVEVGQQLLAIE